MNGFRALFVGGPANGMLLDLPWPPPPQHEVSAIYPRHSFCSEFLPDLFGPPVERHLYARHTPRYGKAKWAVYLHKVGEFGAPPLQALLMLQSFPFCKRTPTKADRDNHQRRKQEAA